MRDVNAALVFKSADDVDIDFRNRLLRIEQSACGKTCRKQGNHDDEQCDLSRLFFIKSSVYSRKYLHKNRFIFVYILFFIFNIVNIDAFAVAI